MQWPEWIYGLFVPVGAAFALLAFVEGILDMLKEKEEIQAETEKEEEA